MSDLLQAFGAIEIVLQPILHYVFPYHIIPEVVLFGYCI